MIRRYKEKDKKKLLQIIKDNIPGYFHASEEEDFRSYLGRSIEDYYVFEEGGNILGCGGLNYSDDGKTAFISWDMIEPNSQGKGIGQQLVKHRIEKVKSTPKINLLVVRTSQLAYLFYEKMGFKLEKTKKDYWAVGFDLYHMVMPLK